MASYHLLQPAGAPSVPVSYSHSPVPPASVPEPMRCKRRIHLSYMVPQQPQQPTAVAKRNERERKRVRMVNMGFTSLRQHVPNGAKNKKLSKVETLRSAIEYIGQLQQLLTGYDAYPAADAAGYSTQQPAAAVSNSDENSCPSEQVIPGYHDYGGAYGSAVVPMGAVKHECATSPTPSLGSDGQSPTETLSSSDEDILSFSTWFT